MSAPRAAMAARPVGAARKSLLASALLLAIGAPAGATTILFVGNSFTYGEPAGAPPAVMRFRPQTVNDLNGSGIGGVPALFKAMTVQAGLDYQVSLETIAGKGLDEHYDKRRALIVGNYDKVILQSYSTLDAGRPGNPALLVRYSGLLAQAYRDINPKVSVMLEASWPRADLVYRSSSPWRGLPIGQMARDLRCGYEAAAAASPLIGAVIPVGEAWIRAIDSGLATADPYGDIGAGQIDLWAPDHYHASAAGYYLAALTIFGSATGKDPAMFGAADPVARDIGIAPATAAALQRHAAAQLAAETARNGRATCSAQQEVKGNAG